MSDSVSEQQLENSAYRIREIQPQDEAQLRHMVFGIWRLAAQRFTHQLLAHCTFSWTYAVVGVLIWHCTSTALNEKHGFSSSVFVLTAVLTFLIWPSMAYFVIYHIRYLYSKRGLGFSLEDHRIGVVKFWKRPQVPRMKMWVVTHNDDVIACVAARPSNVVSAQDDTCDVDTTTCSCAQLERMFILHEYRGKGIAKMLVRYVIRFCEHHGYQTLGLVTSLRMFEAVKLYESMGFVVERTTRTFLTTMVHYKLEL